MQTSNHNVSMAGSQQTIIQMAKNNAQTTTLIQNGQHLLIGKIENTNNSSLDNQSGNLGSNNMQAIYPLQYLDATGVNASVNQPNSDGNNTTVYGSSGQKIFYQDSNHASIYTSMSGQTATIIPASAIQHIKARDLSGQLGGGVGTAVHIQTTPHAQIVHHGGNAYLVQSSARIEDESPNMSHTTKASPVTVQWLCDNYENADGVSLPRSTLYNHYLQHCMQEKLEPMNQASFGKLIRSVFFGLRTRRLGTRGNSKYHYYGIRIKPNSVLNHYVEDHTFAMRQYPSFHRQSHDNDLHWRNRYGNINYGNTGVITTSSSGFSLSMPSTGDVNTANQHSSYLGESSSALPNLQEIMSRADLDQVTEEQCAAEGVSLEDINMFCQMYLDHSDAVLSSVVYLNFKFIESLWQDFWRTSAKSTPSRDQLEEKLPKVSLQRLLKLSAVQSFLQLFDNMFYQSLVEVLIPNVLRPIPSALTQNIRHFAKSLENWMSSSTIGLPREVVQIKMSCVCALAQTLRRHTSLNHLAQAARAVLKNASQISQMLTDLNRVDFANVQEQASWVCGCDSKRVDVLQQDFKRILQQQASLEEWATWLNNVVNDILEPFKGSSQYPHAAHQFILKWSFYSSMVIRDLTLRSAASFGSFHLIRLLYDEYIYYLVEQKVADHLNLTPVAVTGEMGRQLMSSEYGNYGLSHFSDEMDEGRSDLKQKLYKIDPKKDSVEILRGPSRPSSVPRVISVSGALDSDDYRQTHSSNSNPLDSANHSVSSYNNSLPMADDQVDESADDDEGLDEEESQINEQMSNVLSASSITRSFPSTGGIMTQKSELPPSLSVRTTHAPIVISGATSNNNNNNNSSVRKTVNVTTFGDPLPGGLRSSTPLSQDLAVTPRTNVIMAASTIKSSPALSSTTFTTASLSPPLSTVVNTSNISGMSSHMRIKLLSNNNSVSGSTSS